jgi:hypothetical protein
MKVETLHRTGMELWSLRSHEAMEFEKKKTHGSLLLQ